MHHYADLVKLWTSHLRLLYESQEAESLVYWLLEHHLGLRRTDMLKLVEIESLPTALLDDFDRLKSGEPIQYILGKAPFYGREFTVNQQTLIPRNETEELVHLIIKENSRPRPRILDIGTGSGCISVTLALEMNSPEVFAMDVSEEALEVARGNASKLGARVAFAYCDILEQDPEFADLDIIVSNPPYVPDGEKAQMHRNVLDFEPREALFVPNEDPLLFYRVIGEKGKKLITPGGRLYFEVHERFAVSVAGLLVDMGYQNVQIHRDLNAKNRMISAQFF